MTYLLPFKGIFLSWIYIRALFMIFMIRITVFVLCITHMSTSMFSTLLTFMIRMFCTFLHVNNHLMNERMGQIISIDIIFRYDTDSKTMSKLVKCDKIMLYILRLQILIMLQVSKPSTYRQVYHPLLYVFLSK